MDVNLLIAILAVLTVFVIASIIIGIINTSKINSILDYSEDGDLIKSLDKYYNSVRELQKKLNLSREGTMSSRIASCETKQNLGLSKTGIVNFDAFDDVFGKQSFALAILNQYNSGFVLTSLYGNNSSNTYVRTITEGKSDTPLLDEETEAVARAMSSGMNI